MSTQVPGPGKTAPKLLHDFYIFDPIRIIQGYHVLRDPPPIWEDGSPQPRYMHKDACRHEYITLPNQSRIPGLDERSHKASTWKVAAVCQKCRLHAIVLLEFSQASHALCPNAQFPLHHFKYTRTDQSKDGVHFHFVCTSWGCRANLTVSYAPPELHEDTIALVTSKDNLRRRYETILEQDPERKDVQLTTPIEALHRLKRYTDDSLKPTHEKRQFPAHNKKFLGAFGSDCDLLLKSHGFVYAEAGNTGGHVWQLPNPGLTVDPLQPEPMRASLERLSTELQILLDEWSARDGIPNPSVKEPWHYARPDLERALSIQGYERMPNRVLSSTEQDHPCFGALGALGDFADSLVYFAYNRQTVTDPDNTPYYFDCLQQLAQGRASEELTKRVSELVSEGLVGRKELVAAYVDLGASSDLSIARSMEENYLIDLYKAVMADSGPGYQKKLRQSLQKIGQSRNSKAIMNVASNTIETYEDALGYLGADHSMGDEMITALYGSKIGDSPENIDMTRKAVQIIADNRNSGALQRFLTTGELNTFEMDLDEACRHLNMTFDPNVDEGTLASLFMFAMEDSPGKRTEQAISAIRKAFEERNQLVNHAAETWPVGLESHGNTCYLNSLLQYYFTIKPLRDLVLEIDQHKFDLSKFETKKERVQSIHLKRYEVEAYQKFADHLRFLFERMIKTPEPRVRPDTELVCGAFLTPNEVKAVEATRNRDGPASETADIDMGGVGLGKIGEAAKEVPNVSNGIPHEPVSRAPSNASSVTLIEDDDPVPASAPAPASAMLTPPASPKIEPVEPQDKPPLPPRPVLDRAKTQLELAEDAAKRQQDVAEVMEDLLRRLRAAIKPEGQDEHGEQIDQLRDLFNMRFVETVITDGVSKTKKEEDATNILLNVPYEPTDIYSALDRVIDLRRDDMGGKSVETYRTYTSLPPLLQISVPRIALHGGQAIKVNHRLRLEETLYMDRYCSNDQVLPIRQKCWQLRRQLRSLQLQKEFINASGVKDSRGPDLLDDAAKYLSTIQDANEDLAELGMDPIEDTSDVVEGLKVEAQELRARVEPLNAEIKRTEEDLEGQFGMFSQERYRLYAVFFHRGGAGGGHYWTNIFDFKSNIWRTYNDETVEEHNNPADILNAHEWQHGTPTYAVYVRDDLKDKIVQPVCRAPEHPVTEADEPRVHEVQAKDDAVVGEWDDVKMEDGLEEPKEIWTESGPYGNGHATPKKRSSDSPSPFKGESPLKRHHTSIRLKEPSQDGNGSAAGDSSQQQMVMDEDVRDEHFEAERSAWVAGVSMRFGKDALDRTAKKPAKTFLSTRSKVFGQWNFRSYR